MRSDAERLAERVTRLELLVLALLRTIPQVMDDSGAVLNQMEVEICELSKDETLSDLVKQVRLDMERSAETGQV